MRLGQYVLLFTIVDQPVEGRGSIRVTLTGSHLVASFAEGGFNAKGPGSFRGQTTVLDGTLSYTCGVRGLA